MPSPCERRRHVRVGLIVTVLSSADGTTPVCTLGTRTDIRHWVKVENLGGYPVDLTCAGRIAATFRKVEFDIPPGGATDNWTDTYVGLSNHGLHDWSHAGLLPVAGAVGAETVCTELRAHWPQPARSHTETIDIRVTA